MKSTGVGPYAVYGGKPYVPDGIHAACINVEFYRTWSFVAGFVVIVFMWLARLNRYPLRSEPWTPFI